MRACEDISFALSVNQFTFNTSLTSPSDPNKAKKKQETLYLHIHNLCPIDTYYVIDAYFFEKCYEFTS